MYQEAPEPIKCVCRFYKGGSPKAPKPPKPPLPTEAAESAKTNDLASRRRKARGLGSTILTGGLGVAEPGQTRDVVSQSRSLLGGL